MKRGISNLTVDVAFAPWAMGYLTRVRSEAEAAERYITEFELRAHLNVLLRCGGFRMNGKPICAPPKTMFD